MTNVIQKNKNYEIKSYNGKKTCIDFDYSDRKKGIYLFMQTSGVVYRNLYFKDGENESFEKILTYTFPESFRADGFRFEWYLRGGKAHFVNRIESIYNQDGNGLWTSKNISIGCFLYRLNFCKK